MSIRQNELYFEYALKNDELVHVDSVPNGLGCECTCPSCGTKLVAYNNSKNKITHHFKHYSHKDCRNYYETMIHYLAKSVIQEQGGLTIPEITFNLSDYARSYFDRDWIKDLIRPKVISKHVTFDTIHIEKYENGIQPDLICSKNGKSLRIEIAVTHFVDEIKKAKIIELNIPVLEIDLSKFNRSIQKSELKKAICGNIEIMKWIHNPLTIKREQIFFVKINSITDILNQHLKQIKVYGKKYRIYDCPIMKDPNHEVDISNCRNCRYLANEIDGFEHRPDINSERPFQPQIYIHCLGKSSDLFDQILDQNNVKYKDNKAFGK